MSEPQLERSVLEAKEREELFAIANALGTRPTSRVRKSELITQILQATGVETAAAEPEPRVRRARTRKSEPASGQLPLTEEDSTPSAADHGVPSVVVAESAADPGAPAGALRAADPGTGDRDGVSPEAARSVARPSTRRAATEPPGPATSAPGGSATATGPEPAVTSGPGTSAVTGSRARGADSTRRSDSSASRPAPASDAPADRGPGREGAGSPSPASGGDDGVDPARFDGDAGGRRSRRRRGRDRAERSERELPGQAPDQPFTGEPVPVAGLLDLREDGYGFVRTTGSVPGPSDVYVSISLVRRFALRRGDRIEGGSRPATGNEKYPALVGIDTVAGLPVDDARSRRRIDELTPTFPDRRLRLEHPDGDDVVARVLDLVAPIGRGQRGLIVSPPGAGKTTVLAQVAAGIEANHPEVELFVVTVDERPEEVVELARQLRGELVASAFDRPVEEHTQAAELTVERAKRLAESGRDVVVLLDGLTRLAWAYELAQAPSGRISAGGLDAGVLYPLKRMLGAARNLEEGGSVTVLATVAADTGSAIDEIVVDELAGAANMQLRLDRRLAARRIHPAIDVLGSATRHEERLRSPEQLAAVGVLRRELDALAAGGDPAPAVEALVARIRATASNDELLAGLAGNPLAAPYVLGV